MDRREFFKLCSLAGLGVASSQLPGTYMDANAQDAEQDIFPVFVNGGGGWDIFRVADPKDNTPNGEGFAITQYDASVIRPSQSANNILFPDLPTPQGQPGSNAELFDPYGDIMTVINGVDCETNGHDTGQQNFMSGRLQQNSPALPALIAAALGGAKPLAFITNGGYDSTFGVPVSKTRLGDTNSLIPLIYPNIINTFGDNIEDNERFHTEETFSRIMATRQARLDDMQRIQHLPLIKKKMNLLYTARQGMGDLKRINDYLLPIDELNDLANIERQADIALAAFKAGLCSTATVTGGGFDSHGNNDDQQDNSRANLFRGVIRLLVRAEQLDIIDKLFIVVGSDFGRTPRYNEAQGKDHWSVGSVLLLDPSGRVPGNRVLGGTNEVGEYERVDANGNVGGNVTIKNASIHSWMRRHVGIEDNDVVKLFPLNTGDNEVSIT